MANITISRPVTMKGYNALAKGAFEAGVRVVVDYSKAFRCEIMSTLTQNYRDNGIKVEQSANIHDAYKAALNSALVGVRALTTTTQLGISEIINRILASTRMGVKGGLVILTLDEGDILNEQSRIDMRYFAQIARIPVLEPSNVQEAHSMMIDAFQISESVKKPVIFRVTTKICESISEVKTEPSKRVKESSLTSLPDRYHGNHESRVEDAELGIITTGISHEKAVNAVNNLGLTNKISILKLALTHPLPYFKITDFLRNHKKVLVVEEMEPIIENDVHSIANRSRQNSEIYGKMNSYLKLDKLSLTGIMESIEKILNRV